MKKNDSLETINEKMNRLKSAKAALENKFKSQTKYGRMSRTRTLIQLGGLLSLVEIPAWFDIKNGDDLQTDPHRRDQAMMLLGLLATIVEQLPPYFSDEKKDELKQKGMRFMQHHQNNQ